MPYLYQLDDMETARLIFRFLSSTFFVMKDERIWRDEQLWNLIPTLLHKGK